MERHALYRRRQPTASMARTTGRAVTCYCREWGCTTTSPLAATINNQGDDFQGAIVCDDCIGVVRLNSESEFIARCRRKIAVEATAARLLGRDIRKYNRL